MRIIDLLNLIAKGEEVPKKIRYKGEEYHKHKGNDTYYLPPNESNTWEVDTYHLNREIEIIEEGKKIKKFYRNNAIWEEQARDLDYMFKDKIDELIDIINDMRDKE